MTLLDPFDDKSNVNYKSKSVDESATDRTKIEFKAPVLKK